MSENLKALSMLPYPSIVESSMFDDGSTKIFIHTGTYFIVKTQKPRQVRKWYQHFVKFYGNKSWEEK